jgi:hypothetical protein
VCRFRLALVAADLPGRLFAELDRQLAAKGLFVKVTLIDASLFEADVKRPPKDEGEVAERDPTPVSPGGGSGASSATRRIWLSTPIGFSREVPDEKSPVGEVSVISRCVDRGSCFWVVDRGSVAAARWRGDRLLCSGGAPGRGRRAGMTTAWWRSRSSSAVATTGSPKTSPHSAKPRLEVRIIAPFS